MSDSLRPLQPNITTTTQPWRDEFSPLSTRTFTGYSSPLDDVVWQDVTLMEMSTRCHPRGNVALEPVILGWVTLTPCAACV